MKNNKVSEFEDNISKLREQISVHNAPIFNAVNKIEEDKKEYKIANKLYIADLSEHNDKNLSSITAIDKNGEEVFLPLDEIVEVKDGRLYCSSYTGGIVAFDDTSKIGRASCRERG